LRFGKCSKGKEGKRAPKGNNESKTLWLGQKKTEAAGYHGKNPTIGETPGVGQESSFGNSKKREGAESTGIEGAGGELVYADS